MFSVKRLGFIFRFVMPFLLLSAASGAGVVVSAAPQADSVTYLPLIFKTFYTGAGSVTGQVKDAVNSDDLEGAEVCHGSNCTLTDTDGFYTLSGVPAGQQSLSATFPEYYPDVAYITVLGQNHTVEHDFSLSSFIEIGDIYLRTILTWEKPLDWPDGVADDLDMYLYLHNTVYGNIINVFSDPFNEDNRGDCGTSPLACIENWAGAAPGPETMAIRDMMVAHNYYFGIWNVNQLILPDVPSITKMNAYVVILSESYVELERYNVPTTGEGDFWYIFSMTPNGVLTIRNCITTFYGGDVLPTCP